MTEERYVILGAGPAANQAAMTLRKEDEGARITLINKAPFSYYTPHKLPDYIAGLIREKDLFPKDLEDFKNRGIKLRLGQEVVNVDFQRNEVYLAHKEKVHFTGLIIAVGGKPRFPEPLLVYSDLLTPLKTLCDARVWIDKLKDARSVIIIGGDLTSLALTKSLLKLEKQVKFILDEGCFWPVGFNENICEQATSSLRARGVEVMEGRRVRRINRLKDNRIEVETDAESPAADIVGAFFGLVPDIGFLTNTGLSIERGVLVDEHLQTRYDRVYSAGDCAQVYHPEMRNYWVSIGYDNAVGLGRIAAMNLLGGSQTAEVRPTRIFDVDGIKVNTSWWTEF
jgi:NADPH-dependent 2,4-dienoyl-CoA reductase/sulfur reductase-like enzyme